MEVGVEEETMLGDLRSFVQDVPNPETSYTYSSVITMSGGGLNKPPGRYSVELQRKGTNPAGEDCEDSFRIAELTDVLEVLRTLVACPTWTHGKFHLHDEFGIAPAHDRKMIGVFFLLRASPSLSNLDLTLDRAHLRHLPTLLCEHPSLETLTLHARICDLYNIAIPISKCFARNSVLRSCTLALEAGDFDLVSIRQLLRPFTTAVRSEANVALKVLVLEIKLARTAWMGVMEDAVDNLVRSNTSLERFEFWQSDFTGCQCIGSPLPCNRTLKEFGCHCTFEGFREILGVFVPNKVSGHQGNTSLSSLKLIPDCYSGGDEVVSELAKMIKTNTTLKHVEISNERNCFYIWDDWEKSEQPGYVDGRMRESLELMMGNELRLNTTLQSLVVGQWNLHRVGNEWDMIYVESPVLIPKLTRDVLYWVDSARKERRFGQEIWFKKCFSTVEEYRVKVETRRWNVGVNLVLDWMHRR